MLCALLLYLHHDQRRLSERSTAMWQLNLKMQERIARLELVKTDLHRQIRHNEIIYPKKYDHVVFAGEEIEHTRMWLDVLLHSPAFRNLDPSLRTIITDMNEPMRSLDVSFEKIQKTGRYERRRRETIMETELEPAVHQMQELLQRGISQYAFTVQVTGAAALKRGHWILPVISVMLTLQAAAVILQYRTKSE